MSNVVEVVHFSLDPSCTESDLLIADKQMQQFLAEQAGVIYRSLAKKVDGSYVDIIYWQDIESAEAGQQAYYKSEVCKLVGQLTNIESVTIEHANIVSTTGCDV